MKYFKIILIFLIFVGVNGCGNFRDAVTGQTKKTTDEFLIKKKDPLILPPDYDTLPIPKTKKKKVVSASGKPFVSICTPTYNRRKFIPFLIKCNPVQTP